MHGESHNDQKREEHIKRKGDRKVWNTKVDGDGVPNAAVRLRGLVDEHDTHRYIGSVSQGYRGWHTENIPNEARYTRHGKAITQNFLV